MDGITRDPILTSLRRSPEEIAHRVGRYLGATIYRGREHMQWCLDNGVEFTRASGELVDPQGGFLVGDELENAIIAQRNLVGVARRNARPVAMGSDVKQVPLRTSGPTSYFVAENAAVTSSQAAFGTVGLTARKAGVLLKMSSELEEEAITEVGQFYIDECAWGFASLEDSCAFQGDGTSSYSAIQGALVKMGAGGRVAAASGHTQLSAVDSVDLGAFMAALPSWAWPTAKFYCSGAAVGLVFARLGVVSGLPIAAPSSGATPPTPFAQPTPGSPPLALSWQGIPIEIVTSMVGSGVQTGKPLIAFGSLRDAVALGSRRGMAVRMTRERYLDEDAIGLLATERFDANAFNVGSATAPGGLVALIATG